MKAVVVPAIFTKAETLKDNGVKLIFATRELRGDEASTVFGLINTECHLAIATSEDELAKAEIPNEKPDTGQKSPSERLRAIQFIFWRQQGGSAVLGEFDTWRTSVMNRYIDSWKAKLDAEDRNG